MNNQSPREAIEAFAVAAGAAIIVLGATAATLLVLDSFLKVASSKIPSND